MALHGKIVNLLFPPKCAACRTLLDWRIPEGEALCPSCYKLWVSETLDTCGICALRVTDCTCMPIVMQKAGCERLCKLVYYTPRKREPVQNRLIYRMKAKGDRRTARFLAIQMLPQLQKALEECGVDRTDAVLTYLPRSRRAFLQHGTDQARVLAEALSAQSGIPVEKLILRRWSAVQAQKSLSPEARLQNARHAYMANQRAVCKKKTVLLVDDLVTTGAGMAIGTRILRRMGARRVICFAIASDVANKDLQCL